MLLRPGTTLSSADFQFDQRVLNGAATIRTNLRIDLLPRFLASALGGCPLEAQNRFRSSQFRVHSYRCSARTFCIQISTTGYRSIRWIFRKASEYSFPLPETCKVDCKGTKRHCKDPKSGLDFVYNSHGHLGNGYGGATVSARCKARTQKQDFLR